jgi:PGF-CTERM protein
VFNTYEAGSVTGNVPPVTAEGGIEIVSIEEKANTAGVIESTTDADGNQIRDPYPVRFGTQSIDETYANPDTTGGLDLVSRETVDPTLNTWTAPASEVSDLEGATGAEIAQMAADGELTLVDDAPSDGIARSDRLTGDFDALVYQVQAPGIQGFLETRTGTTEDAMIAADALSLTQSNPFFNQAPKRLNLTNDASGLTITQAEGTDTYFIVANVDQLNLSRDTNVGTVPFGSPQVGETYDVAFSIDDRVGTLSTSDDPTEFVEAGFQLNPANINNDGDFEIRIQEEFDVSGTSGLAPGTEFSIVIEDQMTPGSFMFVDNVTVDENGEFSAEYAPQDIPASGSQFELQITVPDFPSAAGIREDGLFREQPTANVTINDQTRIGGDLVVIESGDLSDGGFIAIHEGGPGGPIIGSSKLLAAGSFSDLPIALDEPISENSTLVAMPHFDRPSDGFFRFDGQNDSFYYLTEPIAPGDLPPEGERTPVTDSAEITYIPQEQQEITRTIINTVEVPVDVTRTVTVPVTRTVEVPVEVTRTVIRDRTVEVTRTVTRTVEVVEEVTRTVTRTVEVVEEVTRTVEVTRTIINEEEVTRTVTIIRNVTDTSGQPGLGALVAVIALLAASLLAARRRDW